jgi:hypothetical protein
MSMEPRSAAGVPTGDEALPVYEEKRLQLLAADSNKPAG